jgi:hypothetical protein
MTTRTVASGISAAALVVTVGSTIVGTAIVGDGSTAQGAAFAVTAGSILTGIAAGLATALASDIGTRRKVLRWTAANVGVGLVCAAIELIAALNNM